jgi:hypothetical protein
MLRPHSGASSTALAAATRTKTTAAKFAIFCAILPDLIFGRLGTPAARGSLAQVRRWHEGGAHFQT